MVQRRSRWHAELLCGGRLSICACCIVTCFSTFSDSLQERGLDTFELGSLYALIEGSLKSIQSLALLLINILALERRRCMLLFYA
jgi:hypothetical protein